MASNTEICNLALLHLGVGKEIGNLETEKSSEATACRRAFTICRDNVLRDFNWPFATKFADLALVETDPTDEWGFSYTYPNDCVNFRRIVNDDPENPIPYRIVEDANISLIYADEANPVGEYTRKVTEPARFSPDFVLALSFLVAAVIAPAITNGDPFKVGERAMRLYELKIDNAKANAANEEQPDQPPDSEFITIRG